MFSGMNNNTNFDCSGYFPSYSDLRVHNFMLNDVPRMEAYKGAILDNAHTFKGKTVLDVGAGTGILSLLCAKVGAKRVYAVEACPSLIPIIQSSVEENNFNDIVQVIAAPIEDIPDIGTTPVEDQPYLPEFVDIIISEWMGLFLLHEGMLDSIISARRFLKRGGIIYPDICTVYVAMCELPEFYDKWDSFYGLSMKNFASRLRLSLQTEPQIVYVDEKNIISNPYKVFFIDTKTVTTEDLNEYKSTLVTVATREGKYQGVCIWFDVNFTTQNGNLTLSTSPFAPKTHWKQSLLVFNEEFDVEEGTPVAFHLNFTRMDRRRYQISFIQANPDLIVHEIPCTCYTPRCKLFAKLTQIREEGAEDTKEGAEVMDQLRVYLTDKYFNGKAPELPSTS